MDKLDGFEELAVDKERSEIKIPVRDVEISINVRYFLNGSGVGYCGLLITGAFGKGLAGCIKAAAAKVYIGKTILVFLSELDDGKKLITVPALFEKEPSFDGTADLSNIIVNTYYPCDFKKMPQEVYKEHMNALNGRKIRNDGEKLKSDILELPAKGLEILKSYK